MGSYSFSRSYKAIFWFSVCKAAFLWWVVVRPSQFCYLRKVVSKITQNTILRTDICKLCPKVFLGAGISHFRKQPQTICVLQAFCAPSVKSVARACKTINRLKFLMFTLLGTEKRQHNKQYFKRRVPTTLNIIAAKCTKQTIVPRGFQCWKFQTPTWFFR